MAAFILKLAALFVAVFTLVIWLNFGPPKLQIINANVTPDHRGVIHHPIYGDYPAAIPWDNDAVLLPGQHMDRTFIIPEEIQQESRLGRDNPSIADLQVLFCDVPPYAPCPESFTGKERTY